jgi:hypothetical protein
MKTISKTANDALLTTKADFAGFRGVLARLLGR